MTHIALTQCYKLLKFFTLIIQYAMFDRVHKLVVDDRRLMVSCNADSVSICTGTYSMLAENFLMRKVSARWVQKAD